MDANGLRFWMLATAEQWAPVNDQPPLQYDGQCRRLRLASERLLPQWSHSAIELESTALSRLEQVPQTLDGYGTRAFWEPTSGKILATGALPRSVPIFTPEPSNSPTDLVMGYDGILYLALSSGAVVMIDRCDRWLPLTLQTNDFKAWRLAADPTGGVWVLDRDNRQLGKVLGVPFPTQPAGKYADDIFRPCDENPNPPRLVVWQTSKLPDDEKWVAIATNPDGDLALLTWLTDGTPRVRTLQANQWTSPIDLMGCRYPFSLSWVTLDRIAVLVSDLLTEAPVYAVPKWAIRHAEIAPQVQPVGDLYPLHEHTGNPFLHGVSLPPHYPTVMESAPLYHLSLPSYARQGAAIAHAAFDSGNLQTEWHRLYLEAVIPAKGEIHVDLAATDQPTLPDAPEWFEHSFGAVQTPGKPCGVWVSLPSEIPFHPGLLTVEREKDRSGLFTVLIQRHDRQVRTLQGRYLWVRVRMVGDGRTTPELAALRAYGSRFSYLNHYLPELYRETVFGSDRNEITAATPSDFLERFLANFEGILTPIEDCIANSHLLTDPRTTPDDAIEWLGSWIGVTFDPAYSSARRRRLIEAAPALYRRRGTLTGLQQALDIATDGVVSQGAIVVLEDFRLRRTFATILGADLADETDPLLAGLVTSGNSYVGDTLILGDETRQEFLALFRADIETNSLKKQAEETAIAAFFDQLAYRTTIFVHQEVTPQDLGLIRRVVDMETPAHVLSRVVTASSALMVGVASLVGVDTYLSAKPKSQSVVLNKTQVGVRDRLLRHASLDPRLEGGGDEIEPVFQPPIATLKSLPIAEFGQSFQLDGNQSRAFDGRTIAHYEWTKLE
jgi:phage tail-like protein